MHRRKAQGLSGGTMSEERTEQDLEHTQQAQQATGGGFDLSQARPVEELEDEGIEVHIRDVNGEPMFYRTDDGEERPVTVTVAGTYSSRYRRAQEAQTTRTLRRRATNLDGEQLQERRLELIAACVLDWQGFFDQGKAISLTKQNCKVVMRQAPWIREQVEAAMEDHLGFTERS